jgi:hypothetical protein
MITTILIVLVAVVVLIVIIAVLALRYLRADDSDTFDDIPDEPRPRRAPDRDHDQRPARPEGRPRQREAAAEARAAARPVRSADARRQQPGYRDRDTGARPAVPERAGSGGGGQRRTAAAAQSARAPRADDPDSANSWDSLSDVDYWAELSADKPRAAAATSGPAAAARRAAEGPITDPRQPSALPRQLPVRPVGGPAGRGAEPAPGVAASLDAPGRRLGPRPGTAPRPAAAQRPPASSRPALPQRHQLAAAQVPPGNGPARTGGPADDDPLTSPSFPAINAADSRSYRTRRSPNSQPGRTGAGQYPAGPARTSRPDGYPVQSPAPQAPLAQSPSSLSGSPAANPYGSYVSTPSTYQGPSYPDPAAASRPPADHPGYPAASQAAGGSNWLPPPAFETSGAAGSTAADGYLPATGLAAGGQATGRHAHGGARNGSLPRGYAEIDYSSLRYDDPVYPDTEAAGMVGYTAPGAPGTQYEQNGYGSPDLGYSQEDYSGYSAGGR